MVCNELGWLDAVGPYGSPSPFFLKRLQGYLSPSVSISDFHPKVPCAGTLILIDLPAELPG